MKDFQHDRSVLNISQILLIIIIFVEVYLLVYDGFSIPKIKIISGTYA